jgi:DNA modification methylase
MTRRERGPIHRGAEPPIPGTGSHSRIAQGDVLKVLAALPEESVQTVVTSPPYWGLRDYGLPPTVWGADPSCRHRWDRVGQWRRGDAQAACGEGRRKSTVGRGSSGAAGGRFCLDCGAWRGCLGLEPDPNLYVEHLVEVMRSVRRCLRHDGPLWLNLGDSFAARRISSATPDASSGGAALKQKDLIGIPWRVAFALQADGWWLRAENVWNKPNAMPESVDDPPTRAHEYVFLLAPSARYFYDSFAVREPDQGRRSGNGFVRPERLSYGGSESPRGQSREWVGGGGRNRRSVWTIATQCFRDAHFATFPEALVEVCVLAGSSPVACGTCGAPWSRAVESKRLLDGHEVISGGWTDAGHQLSAGRSFVPTGYGAGRVLVVKETVGWRPGCDHDDPGGRCTVLDPFAGSGTTGLVAARHGRDFLGVELSHSYVQMARGRLRAPSTRSGPKRRRG